MSKRAVITGITWQDGSYLAELLLEEGYRVVGVVRRSSAPNLDRIEHLLDRIELRPADLLDQLSLVRLIDDVRPHELYNLAAMSFVRQTRACRSPVAGESRCLSRLGIRRRLRGRHVVDAVAGRSGRLRCRDGG
jgi:GDPmannose 4,6-dehydratase